MRKGIALVCTVFLLSSGYAQSKRVGVFLTPQYNFSSKDRFNPESDRGKGLTFGGGAYFEMNNGGVGASFGLGYTKLSNTVTVDAVGTTRKMEFVSLPFIGTYEFNITEKFLLGLHVHVGLNYLISEKLDEIAVSSGKKLYTSYGGGLSFSYLFSDAIGISVLPAFSAMLVFEPGSPIYMGFGGQFRFFYAFGY